MHAPRHPEGLPGDPAFSSAVREGYRAELLGDELREVCWIGIRRVRLRVLGDEFDIVEDGKLVQPLRERLIELRIARARVALKDHETVQIDATVPKFARMPS